MTTNDPLLALLRKKLGLPEEDDAQETPAAGSPIALNNDAALAAIAGGKLNTSRDF